MERSPTEKFEALAKTGIFLAFWLEALTKLYASTPIIIFTGLPD